MNKKLIKLPNYVNCNIHSFLAAYAKTTNAGSCYSCKRKGHWANNCPAKKAKVNYLYIIPFCTCIIAKEHAVVG